VPPSTEPLVEIQQLTKRFGSVTAVWKVELQIQSGEFWVVLGPNGAGKSTLLRMIAQLTRPSEGTVKFGGTQAGRDRVGYVSHQSLLYGDLTGFENLVFFARLYQHPDPEGRSRELLAQMHLEHALSRPVRGYSSGMKQRLTLARALLHEPQLLILDEPYAGLDQHGSRLLTQVLLKLKGQGRTVLMITHNLVEGLALSSHVMIMNRGQVVFRAARSEIDATTFESLYFKTVDG
jgi:heme exporter protein A